MKLLSAFIIIVISVAVLVSAKPLRPDIAKSIQTNNSDKIRSDGIDAKPSSVAFADVDAELDDESLRSGSGAGPITLMETSSKSESSDLFVMPVRGG